MRRPRESGLSIAGLLLVGAFSFAGAWQLGWWAADRRAGAPPAEGGRSGLGRQMQLLACGLTPSLPFCAPRLGVVVPAAHRDGRSYRELFASLPDLDAALDKLRWNGGDEAEAARLLTLMKSLELGRYRQAGGARERLAALVAEIWTSHPELAMASSCVYCGTIASSARELLRGRPPPDRGDWIERFAAGHPVHLGTVVSGGALAPERVLALAVVQGELFSAGDRPTARAIGATLLRGRRHDALLAWVTEGLHGSWSLGSADLSQVPLPVVTGAWERGVRIADVPVRLTDFLLGQGHRPALRWLVWVLDGGADYVRANRSAHRELLRRHLDLPPHPGQTLAQFYSRHWRRIAWDPEAGRWRLLR